MEKGSEGMMTETFGKCRRFSCDMLLKIMLDRVRR